MVIAPTVVALAPAVMVVDMLFDGAMGRPTMPSTVTRFVVEALVVVPAVRVPPMALRGIGFIMGPFTIIMALAVVTAGPGASCK